MTKSKRRSLIRETKTELERLAKLERIFDPSSAFILRNYSKRRARLVRTFWALKGGAIL